MQHGGMTIFTFASSKTVTNGLFMKQIHDLIFLFDQQPDEFLLSHHVYCIILHLLTML
jgi:hypothetical protein